MIISAIIASKGRSSILSETIKSLQGQSRKFDEIIVVITSEEDCERDNISENVQIFISKPGGSVQRNFGIEKSMDNSDLIVFLDDDVEISSNYLTHIEGFFTCFPEAAAVSGKPLLDFPEDGKMSRKDAISYLKKPRKRNRPLSERGDLYGCNMVIRKKVLLSERFDERLVGYSYLEDMDLGFRVKKHGPIFDYGGDDIIHLGVRSGRISQRRLGYAQIINPLYLYFHKKTLSFDSFAYSLLQVPLGNLLGALGILNLIRKNTELDHARKERVRGNLDALLHSLLNGIDPESTSKYRV